MYLAPCILPAYSLWLWHARAHTRTHVREQKLITELPHAMADIERVGAESALLAAQMAQVLHLYMSLIRICPYYVHAPHVYAPNMYMSPNMSVGTNSAP